MQQLCRGRSARLCLCGKDLLLYLSYLEVISMVMVLNSSVIIVQACNGLERTIDKEEVG